MSDRVSEFRKAARAVAAASRAVNAALRAQERNPAEPVEVHASSKRAARELARVGDVARLAAGLGAEFEARAEKARAAAERERALLAGKVASGLNEAGIRVTGNLPKLRAGPFTLEFDFGEKPRCVVWFGPMKDRLLTCAIDPDTIVGKVLESHERLFGGEWDGQEFLADLDSAYRVTAMRLGLSPGEKVPLTSILVEMAFQGQGPGFLANPRRELYVSYGRVEFAADLSRLRRWRLADRELRLDVATMAQTRDLEGYVWVPRGDSVDGVNYATARFVKIEPGED